MMVNGKQTDIKIFVTKIAADTPAKASLLNMILYNGKFGCPSCETPGATTKKGKGYNRSYHFSLSDAQKRRSKASMRRQGSKADATKTVFIMSETRL